MCQVCTNRIVYVYDWVHSIYFHWIQNCSSHSRYAGERHYRHGLVGDKEAPRSRHLHRDADQESESRRYSSFQHRHRNNDDDSNDGDDRDHVTEIHSDDDRDGDDEGRESRKSAISHRQKEKRSVVSHRHKKASKRSSGSKLKHLKVNRMLALFLVRITFRWYNF